MSKIGTNFGEEDFTNFDEEICETRREFSAKALTDCELLVLNEKVYFGRMTKFRICIKNAMVILHKLLRISCLFRKESS